MLKEPRVVEAFFDEVTSAAGADTAVQQAKDSLTDLETIELRARRVEHLAITLQASLLVRHGHPAVAEAFCATRLAGDWGHAYGTLPPGLDLSPIIERATPKTA
ncbi:hypothetical protein ACGFNU_40865 [Spirillospora sp. NPDC048911]|uniref:hypothetical protein n=1 Tax=Spirillospora sp. NPDC048911 TaxID=3364527 RepID=UPI003711B702